RDARTGETIPSVNVTISGTSLGAATNTSGAYTVSHVPAGTYTVEFASVGFATVRKEMVSVVGGASVAVDADLEATEVSLAGVSVYAASLRRERITEAPAAVSVIEEQDIRLNGGSGQLPRLLEAEPGVDIVQSGIQD